MHFIKKIQLLILIFFTCLFISCCKDKTVDPPAKEIGTVTDIDGNVYQTIKIGEQWWMAENLKVTKFRNGISIIQKQDDNDWKVQAPAYCIYYNSTTAPGLLYNYFAVNDSNKLAPLGWHVPTDDEWKQLELFLGMSQEDTDKLNWRGANEGEKLKIESPYGWTTYGSVWSTNESGFTALAGSCRLFNATWGDPGLNSTGFWWTSTGHPEGAWFRHLDYKNKNIFRYYTSANYGFSVRCVKD